MLYDLLRHMGIVSIKQELSKVFYRDYRGSKLLFILITHTPKYDLYVKVIF